MSEKNEKIETQNYLVQQIASNQTQLRAFVRCLLVRPSDVDDVLQEVNSVLWEKADSFEVGTNFWAWASQIARFKVLNHIRGYSRERLVFDLNTLESLAIVAEKKLSRIDDQREALDHCLKGLMPAQRQILDLRYTNDHSIERIAETIGRPAGSIRQTLYRIRLALLACMQEQLAPGSLS